MEFNIYHMNERIDEKFDWNEIKQYGKGILIGTLLGLVITPSDLKNDLYRKVLIKQVSNQLSKLKEYKKDSELITAIKSVIRKVESSNYITNKEEVINRLNNVVYKEYESLYLFRNYGGGDTDDNLMSYYYDTDTDKDYIMINMEMSHDHKLLSYIHELNHLVDKHSKIDENNKVKSTDLLIDISKYSRIRVQKLYYDYYRNWGEIKKGDQYYNPGIILYFSVFGISNDDSGGMGETESNEKYYISDSEIFARISTMKSFMLKEGILNNIDEKITKHHIELIRLYVYKFEGDYNEYMKVLDLGFLQYLPLINWDKVNELNLIAKNDSDSNINDLT